MNKINKLFSEVKDRKLLSLYFCAGYPTLEGTADVIMTLQKRGIDMIEVGIPFSDPLADGPVIQSAATKALKNGMTLSKLFAQLAEIKNQVNIPLVMMGYLNVITAQASMLSAQRSLIDVRSRRLAAVNTLLKNVAGSWQHERPGPQTRG